LQDEKEHVNEVEVKRQGAGDRCPSPGSFQLLGVVGSEADEDDQADAADDELEHVGVQKDIHDGGDDYSYQPHEAERAERGQVTLGGKAVDAHHGKGPGRGEECGRYGLAGVDEENPGEGDAVQSRVEQEKGRRDGGSHAERKAADRKDQPQFNDKEPKKHRPVTEQHGEQRR